MSKEQQDIQRFTAYREDPWLFLCECVFTKDQVDQKNPIKPFPKEWPYLRLYVLIWMRYRRLAVPKSRRMTMSWTNIALYLHQAMFFPTQDFAFVSKKEDDAAELVRRAEFIYDHIPPDKIPKYLLPKKRTRAQPAALEFPELDSKIQGFPMGADQLRQFTFSGILGDECAFWEEARAFYAASQPTTEGGGRMSLISSRSPGFFQRLVYDQLYHDDEIAETACEHLEQRPFGDDSVIFWINERNKFAVFDVHYTANPRKSAPGFAEGVRASMPIKDYLVEYERNWEVFEGKPVFEDYSKRRHESPVSLEPHLGLPLLLGWDFGHTPAAVVAQYRNGQLLILREFVSEGKGIKQFCPIVMDTLRTLYPGWSDQRKDFRHYIDPAGLAKAQDDNTRSCFTEMAGQGLRSIFPGPISWEERRKSVEHFLLMQTKDGPGLLLSPKDCPILSKGFSGGYKYPERYAQVEPRRAEPIKDRYSHPHDALQYLCGGALSLTTKKPLVEIPVPEYAFTREDTDRSRKRKQDGYNFGT